jgi:ubiquinone/menaquinone biosynthesis C-methylase UbiE
MIDIPKAGFAVNVLEQVLHHHFTQALGGLLPSATNPHKLRQVLDVNCHTGLWAIDLALSYPSITITGIDSSHESIEIARQSAELAALSRVRFYETDLRKALNLSDNSFDLVHLFTNTPLLRPAEWPMLLRECKRVMRPGAVINLASMSFGPSSSEAYQRIVMLSDQLRHAQGYSFSDRPGTSTPGVYFCRMLREAGFADVRYEIHPVNFGGWNNSAGRSCCQLFLQDMTRLKHLLLEYELIEAQDFDEMVAQKREDIVNIEYCASGGIISAVATRL